MGNKLYYKRLVGGSLVILGMFFLWFLAKSPSLMDAVTAVLLAVTLGISIGAAAIPGVLACIVASSCLMGYGLVVRRRYALSLFWGGFALFILAGMMGIGIHSY
jgi:hypothetical protein